MSETKRNISRFPVPLEENLPEAVKPIWDGAKEHFEFIPNVVKALSHRPAEISAFLAYNTALTAFYNMSNRVMGFLAVRPDDEFYTLGR